MMSRTQIEIRRLKTFAFTNFPKYWPIRQILLLEDDLLDVNVFLARVPLWLRLIKLSGDGEKT